MIQETNDSKRTIGKYHVVRTIGSGMFKVKLVYDPVSGTEYAAKVCKDIKKKAILDKEAKLLAELNQADIPHLIKYVDYIDNTNDDPKESQQHTTKAYNFKSALILELAPNGTLFDIIFHNEKLEEKLARTYFKKLVESVASLHSKGYVHRDLKAENFLLDENFQLKLADFGCSRDFDEFNKNKMMTKLGTENYLAPEMYCYRSYSGVQTDSFACGVILFIFIFGRPPFFRASPSDAFYRYFAQDKPEKLWKIYEEKLNNGDEYDKDLKFLINNLLKFDPNSRMEIGQIGSFEWMKREVYSDQELAEVMKTLKEKSDESIKKQMTK